MASKTLPSVALACTVCAAATLEENTTNLLVSFYRLRVAELLTHVNASGGIQCSSCVVQCDQKRSALSLIMKKSLKDRLRHRFSRHLT